jgi:hypothetical protein
VSHPEVESLWIRIAKKPTNPNWALRGKQLNRLLGFKMAVEGKASFVFYHYTPSVPAAVVFTALFGISSLLHLYQLFRKRTWYFIPFVIGGFCKSRQANHQHLIIHLPSLFFLKLEPQAPSK